MIDERQTFPPIDPVVIELRGMPEGKGRGRVGRLKNGRPMVFTPAATRKYEDALRYAASQAMQGRAPLEGALSVQMRATFPVPTSWSKKKQAAALGLAHRELAWPSLAKWPDLHPKIYPCVKPDVDNLLKTLDALNEVVWRDDKQVCEATVVKRYGAEPGIAIVVRVL